MIKVVTNPNIEIPADDEEPPYSQIQRTNIARGAKVLKDEIDGLIALSTSVDVPFSDAVERIHDMKQQGRTSGRLIVGGIGKSGHVARKIAATLSSTGTPAYFVHPGEASHGDMGMITKNDVVMILSNSGENLELSDIIHYTRRFDITLIAITSEPKSTLAKYADICMPLPAGVREACPNGLAPTTSTTMMLALGDALAVALLHRMELTPDQYKVYHPGGKLGQKLLTVSEIMIQFDDLPLVGEDAKMDQGILVLSEKNLGAAIVVDQDNNVKGIITDGDLKRNMAPDLLQRDVRDIMSETPKSIESDALAVKAVDVMTKVPGQYLTSLLVMKDGKLNGMIRLQDCIQNGIA